MARENWGSDMTPRDSITAQNFTFATSADFCKVFEEDMPHLYRLAFLLTGDHSRAEQCFLAGLEEARAERAVFADWARSWSRRSVIKNAIRLMAAVPGQTSSTADLWRADKAQSDAELSINSVTTLRTFERFVFVMSVLESYPDRDCANLLNCTRQDVRDARARALRDLGASYSDSATKPVQALPTVELALQSS
jgi:DNA-directed RNA polymerase specialized sigma24 family protein